MVTLVADGEIDGRPASKNVLPVASDSPEKPGPIRPQMESSLTICVARPGAVSGLPWESNFFRLTLQSAFLSLYCFSASSMPLTMFWPSAPASPVSAPRKARFLPQSALLALPLSPLSPLSSDDPHAAVRVSAATPASAANPRRNFLERNIFPPSSGWMRDRRSAQSRVLCRDASTSRWSAGPRGRLDSHCCEVVTAIPR